jgi:hypothetical protein
LSVSPTLCRRTTSLNLASMRSLGFAYRPMFWHLGRSCPGVLWETCGTSAATPRTRRSTMCAMPRCRPQRTKPACGAPPFRLLGNTVDLDTFQSQLRDHFSSGHPGYAGISLHPKRRTCANRVFAVNPATMTHLKTLDRNQRQRRKLVQYISNLIGGSRHAEANS